MKVFKSIALMFAAMVLAVSCSKDEPVVVEYLDVTPNNIAGEWKLVEWNGAALNADTYFYVNFVRKDREFVIYQNFDSIGNGAHKAEGNYSIAMDVELGAIISGNYKWDGGFWAHEYEVNNLTKTTMEWVATDDSTFVQKFERCDIPAELK
jgi:hypothetical protein